MGMAVEEREDGDERCGRRRVELHRHRDQQPERDDGGKDRRLDERQADAADGKAEARGHGGDEGGGHGPKRPAAGLRGPEADGDHDEDMVEAEERMGEAGHEGAVLLRVEMGEGRRGRGAERGECQRDASDHDVPCLRRPLGAGRASCR